VRDVLEAAPHDLAAHGEADEMELGPELEVVGQLRDVESDALLRPGWVGVALGVPGPVEGQQVDSQLLQQPLHQFPTVRRRHQVKALFSKEK